MGNFTPGSRISIMMFAGAAMALPIAGLDAAGGGGGGMGGAPSAAAPSYDPAAEYRAGVEALQQGRYAAARQSFDHVLSVVPRDANANYLAGVTRMALKDNKGAARYFVRAIKADKNLIDAHRDYGLVLIASGERDKAKAELETLKARQAQCSTGCAQAAELKGAVDALSAALALGPQSRREPSPGLLFASADGGDQAYAEAVGLINEHRYQTAIETLERARHAFGPHPDILTYLGFANRKLGRFDVAEAYYRQALAIAPDHRGATEYYGEMLVERGDLAGARRMLAKLDTICAFGCYEAEELRRWIRSGHGSLS